MLIDLHVHSNYTRGCSATIRDVVRRAREAGLDGVAITDLNTLEGLAEVREAVASLPAELRDAFLAPDAFQHRFQFELRAVGSSFLAHLVSLSQPYDTLLLLCPEIQPQYTFTQFMTVM